MITSASRRFARVRRAARAVTMGFLAGAWTRGELLARGAQVLDLEPAALAPIVRRVLRRFPQRPLGREPELVEALCDHEAFRQLVTSLEPPVVARWLVPEPEMVPVSGPPAHFEILPLPSPGALAERLAIAPSVLDWFADVRRMNTRSPRRRLHHYHPLWVRKASGGYRLLEAPKPRLRTIQRWLLDHVLTPIPVSAAAHAFVPGRDVRSFVAPHVGRRLVVRLDLEDFFASIGWARIVAIFLRVGYPRSVARILAGLGTTATPASVLRAHPRDEGDAGQRFLTNARLRDRHLPQGAPSSPALSNLAAFGLDRRLTALAAGYGATMTRYADDLAFAGDEPLERNLTFFLGQAEAIARDEGFRLKRAKTRVMPRGQRQELCGLVVNEAANLPRREDDNLRALLFNAARFGPHSQNRAQVPSFREHLQGRVAWAAAINPVRGRRLWALFDRIPWNENERSPGG